MKAWLIPFFECLSVLIKFKLEPTHLQILNRHILTS
jgi:hypothetical protein